MEKLTVLDKMLLDAGDDDTFDEFDALIKTLGTHDPRNMIASLMVSQRDPRYLKSLLRHPHTTFDELSLEIMMEGFLYHPENTVDRDDLYEALTRLNPKTHDTVLHLVFRAALVPITFELALRALVNDFSLVKYNEISWIFFTRFVSEECDDPLAHIRACVDGGFDLSSSRYVLPGFLNSSKPDTPGVVRELLKCGIPKSAAYVTKYLKSARYRNRLVMNF